jgi:hypothetical protein
LLRKAMELVVAGRLERRLGKDRILELYLNVAEWGPGLFGAEAAAQAYFGRSAANLSLEQAAALAGTLPHPLTSNPATSPARMQWRQSLILDRLRPPPGVEPAPIPLPDPDLVLPPDAPMPGTSEIVPPDVPAPDTLPPEAPAADIAPPDARAPVAPDTLSREAPAPDTTASPSSDWTVSRARRTLDNVRHRSAPRHGGTCVTSIEASDATWQLSGFRFACDP